MKKKILIISPGYMTVPAINGGAIENLIDTITLENEIYKYINIDVVAVTDGNQTINNKKFTNYKYINNMTKKYKLSRLLCASINKIPCVYIGNAYIRKCCKLIKKEINNYDMIIVENNPLYVLNLKKIYKKPIILHLHNDYLNNRTKFNKKILNSYAKIYTVSNYIGSRIKTIDKKTNKIKTLYNGIDLKKFNQMLTKKEIELERKKYGIEKSEFVFLYTGRIIPEKGVKELILAFNNVSSKNKDVKLLIVGTSSFKNGSKTKYIKEINKLVEKNKQNIKFTGYINYDEIFKIYKCSNAQVVPSIWGEPLATTVIEGMATKTSLIVNKVGGIPEMVGQDGALFTNTRNIQMDLEKNMNFIINTKNSKQIYFNKQRAYKKSLKFSKEIFYKNYIKLLGNVNN